MSFIKRDLPVVISFILGIIVITQYFWIDPTLTITSTTIQGWAVVIWAFMMSIGVINIFIRETRSIISKKAGQWYYSIIIVVFLSCMILTGIIGTTNNPIYLYLFNNFNIPINQAVASLLAFFTISAAFRAFKARSLEVLVLLFSACVVLLGNVPIGSTISWTIPWTRDWILNVPNLAYSRGINAGAALGILGLGIRTLLGYQRSAYGMGAEE